MKDITYQMVLGRLLYAAQATRPDTAFAVGDIELIQCEKIHWDNVNISMEPSNMKSAMKKTKWPRFMRCADAEFADDVDDRKSITEYVL
ncbi:hypothetical protein JTB14_035301 [Gonioctena quinquepunctata]|nr:hypothetical protein JTB14_035301 [Gonioctena quinquepunctata]